MKKLCIACLILTVLLSLCVCFVGCGDQSDNGNNTIQEPTGVDKVLEGTPNFMNDFFD